MAPSYFDRAVYVQNLHFIDEVTCLEEVFDFLDKWPEQRRDIAYHALYGACRRAANGSFPLDAIRENFERFVKRAGLVAEVQEIPAFRFLDRDRNVGNA
jgi:predicted protein tyrosine phosphatase